MRRQLNVLIGCEKTQAVCKAFRVRGHIAFSCDKQPCTGGHPEWHIIADVLTVVSGGVFVTQAGTTVVIRSWDIGIFHPECKDLCWSGERWFTEGKKDITLRVQAFEFFKSCYNAPIPRVAVENSLSWFLRRNFMWETQTVHPYHFGSPYKKSICLWLRGLPPLIPTNIVFKRESAVHNMWPQKGKDRSAERAKTDLNVADAFAEQWGFWVGCDCQKPFGNPAHISNYCPVHNEIQGGAVQ